MGRWEREEGDRGGNGRTDFVEGVLHVGLGCTEIEGWVSKLRVRNTHLLVPSSGPNPPSLRPPVLSLSPAQCTRKDGKEPE